MVRLQGTAKFGAATYICQPSRRLSWQSNKHATTVKLLHYKRRTAGAGVPAGWQLHDLHWWLKHRLLLKLLPVLQLLLAVAATMDSTALSQCSRCC